MHLKNTNLSLILKVYIKTKKKDSFEEENNFNNEFDLDHNSNPLLGFWKIINTINNKTK